MRDSRVCVYRGHVVVSRLKLRCVNVLITHCRDVELTLKTRLLYLVSRIVPISAFTYIRFNQTIYIKNVFSVFNELALIICENSMT